MKQPGVLFLVGLLAACAAQPPRQAAEDQAAAQPAPIAARNVCRLGPDGGPLVADRGIGGTGAPAAHVLAAASAQVADRGIGGTGISGTGVVGVITGFASVCVNGLEVAYDETAPVDINGTTVTVSALRVGQVVMIQADGPAAALHARKISLRQEVSGRIEAVELGSGLLTIAGVPVSVPHGTWGANRFGLGDWVAVSGLRRPDGVVVASRLDTAPSGLFATRGQVIRSGDVMSVGRLALTGAVVNSVHEGDYVSVTGEYSGGQKQVKAINADPLFVAPQDYFGSRVDHLEVQGFVRVVSGGVWLNGVKINASLHLHGQAGPDGIAVVSLDRGLDGSFSATGLQATDFRTHALADASRSNGSSPSAVPPAGTRHAPLTASTSMDGRDAGGLSIVSPIATSSHPDVNPSQTAGPSTTPDATNTAVKAVTATNGTPVNITPIANMQAAVPPGSAASAAVVPSIAASALPNVNQPPPPAVAPAALPSLIAPAALPPLAPASGTPQGENIGSPLISSNGGAAAATSVASAKSGFGIVLPSQVVHAHSVSGVTMKPTINLVTTVGPQTVNSIPSGSGLKGTTVTSSKPSVAGASGAGKH